MSEPIAPQAVNPDDLMAGVKRHSFLALVLISVLVHVVLIFATSIGYMRMMRQYKSWHPRIDMKLLAKKRREEDVDARRKAAHEKFLAEQGTKRPAEKGAEGRGPAAKDTPAPTTATKAGGEKAKVLKDIEAKSTERPKDSSLKLNELDAP